MSVVGFTLRLGGDVSSFNLSVQSQIKRATAARAGVDPSAVELTISPGSVIVGVSILTPTATAATVQSTMATATNTTSSATAMFASVTGISIAVLAVVTPPTIANVAPPPPPLLTGAVAVETSGSIGIIIGVIVGAIIVLVLALVFMRRRRRLNIDKAPKGGQATKAVEMAEAQKEESERDENLISSTGSRSLFASSVKLTGEDRTSVRLRQPTNVRRSHKDLFNERISKMGPGRTRARTARTHSSSPDNDQEGTEMSSNVGWGSGTGQRALRCPATV